MFLLELLIQLVGEVFLEGILELLLEAFKRAFGRENHGPVLATLGYLLLGAAVGGASIWLFPDRFLSPGPFPGMSVLIAPLVGGGAMHYWGKYRRARGHATTNLATFYGGAAFLFACSLVRVLWAR